MADIDEDGEITEEDLEAADESISRGDTIDESRLLKNILEYAAANNITVSQDMLPLILIEELKIRVAEIENKLREVKSRITFSGVKGGLGGDIHSYLSGLDYASAGHTGFAGTGVANTFTLGQNINCNSTTALLVEQDGVKDNTLIVDTTNGYVGVNVVPTNACHVLGTMSIQSGLVGLLLGADSLATTRTDATIKRAMFGALHYTLLEEPVGMFYVYAGNGTNLLYYGGGTSYFNAATSHTWYTAANSTTITGTARLTLIHSSFTITGAADGIQLQVKANATQTANLQTWENSTGTVYGYMSGGGYLYLSQTVNQNTWNTVTAHQLASTLQDGSAFTGTDTSMTTMYIAVKFTASAAHTMGDFEIRVKDNPNVTYTTYQLIGYIYADNGGSPSKPTGAALASGTGIKYGTITLTYQVLPFSIPYTMVNGTTYWLVVKWNVAPVAGTIVLDSDVSANMGATSTDGNTWTNTNARLYYLIRGLTGRGISASCTTDYAIYGLSVDNYGVYGLSTNQAGVIGTSVNSYGVYASSSWNAAVYGTSTDAQGVYGISSSGVGVQGVSTSNVGVTGTSTSNLGGAFYTNPSSTNTTVEVLRVMRSTSGTAAANIGGSIDSYVEDASGNANLAGRIANILTTATHGSEVSALAFWVDNLGAGIAEVMRIQGDVGFIFNDGGLPALDFRVESDNQVNGLFLDASTDILLTNAIFQTGGGRRRKTRTVTGNDTLTVIDETVVCNKVTAMTETILTATGSGQIFTIVNINTGTVTISKAGDTINRVASQTLGQDESITIQDVAANTWVII